MNSHEKKNAPEIKKISENIYINVSKIKTEPVDLDTSEKDQETPLEKSKKDRNQGDETVGIP